MTFFFFFFLSNLNNSSNPEASDSSLWIMQKYASLFPRLLTHKVNCLLNRYFHLVLHKHFKFNKKEQQNTNRVNWPHQYTVLEHTFAYFSHLISMSNNLPSHIDFYLMSLIFTFCKTGKARPGVIAEFFHNLERTHFCCFNFNY